MSETYRNQGIHQTGGTFQAGAVSIGKHARAEGTLTVTNAALEQALEQKGMQEVLQRLKELQDAFNAEGNALGEKESAKIAKATENVAEELSKDEPNEFTLIGTLSMIVEGVKSVTGIATAAQALKMAVEKLF